MVGWLCFGEYEAILEGNPTMVVFEPDDEEANNPPGTVGRKLLGRRVAFVRGAKDIDAIRAKLADR